MASGIKRISTHVLDIARGRPASDLPVRLERQEASGCWRSLSSTRTNHEGRCSQLLPETEDLCKGLYRLAFDTASYYASPKVDTLYPVIEVTFRVRDGESQFHIPLLLSPNGYTTYRGS
ncbi:MAG: hydroxyisourate hydrolase [Acidobacteria bacterium]|nr:hydroxyisourate hydrolase [Acidobacteriota bacterium]